MTTRETHFPNSARICGCGTPPCELTRQLQAWLQQQLVPEQTAFTPRQFRMRNGGITESVYYEMMRQGRGPVTMRMGTTVLISAEEERNWQRRMSRPTGLEAARQKVERQQAQQRSLRAAQASAASPHHVSKRKLAPVTP
jgi:hypothetical protein